MFFSEEFKNSRKEATKFTKFDGEVGIAYSYTHKGKDYYRVLSSFSYYVGKETDNKWIIIPKDFITDGASNLRLLWSFVPPWGKYGPAVIVHDYLCRGKPIIRNGVPYFPGRKETDKILLEAMEVLKVPKFTRLAMYAGVRLYAYVTLDFS